MTGLDVSYPAAFGAGVLSFLSPCVLPLVPPYLCYLGGISAEQLLSGERRPGGHLLAAAALFVLGFGTVFIALGATASVVGQAVARWSGELALVAGVLIMLLGLHFLGLFRAAPLLRDLRFDFGARPAGLLGAYVMGLAFAFGWTPCVGPVLAAILFVAGSEPTLGYGVTLLATYALGLGLPFLLAAALVHRFLPLARRLRAHLPLVERATGALLVVAGLLFLTGGMPELSYWLLETFPVLGRIG